VKTCEGAISEKQKLLIKRNARKYVFCKHFLVARGNFPGWENQGDAKSHSKNEKRKTKTEKQIKTDDKTEN